jgi:Polyketide cyclase / dehydrase and lipid transport
VRIRVGITIDAPPGAVWDAVEAIEHHVDWMVDAASITFTSTTTRGVGTRFDCVTRVGPFRTTDRMTVTEWAPGRAMGIEHHGVVTGRGRFTLGRRFRNRTRFGWTEELTFPWWMGGRAGALVAKPVLRAIWKRNLRALKRIVEASG